MKPYTDQFTPWQITGAPMKINGPDLEVIRAYSHAPHEIGPASKNQVEAVTTPAILRMMTNART